LRTSIIFLAALLAQAQEVVFHMGGNQPPPGLSWAEDGGAERSSGLVMTGSATSTKGVVVEVRTVAEPPLKVAGAFSGGVTSDGKTVHRLLVDKKSESYFGYDLVVESGDVVSGYRVSFRALSNIEEMRSRFAPGTPLKLMPPSRYPPAQTVHEGDTVALDVLVSADGQQKIVDYLKISPPFGDPPPTATTATPRDMTVDDERPALAIGSFSRTAFFCNGQRSTARIGFSAGTGGVLWLYVPDRGRYILALSPHPGFARAGTIRDNVLFVQDEDLRYELRLASPIAGAGNAWNLYVRHDPHYWPRPVHADAVILGFGRMDFLLPKR
jgi:hypothetical protein